MPGLMTQALVCDEILTGKQSASSVPFSPFSSNPTQRQVQGEHPSNVPANFCWDPYNSLGQNLKDVFITLKFPVIH